MKNENAEKKPGKLKAFFNKVARALSMAKPIAKDTMKDLKSRREIGLLVATIILPVPGITAAYVAYRTAVYYRKQQPSNDNIQKPEMPVIKKDDAKKKRGFFKFRK